MKKVISCLLAVLMFFIIIPIATISVSAATTLSYPPYAKVEYNYTTSVTTGTIRYISQIKSNSYFNSNYWGSWASQASSECGTSSISMALSYVGINKTPKQILDAHSGITYFSGWGESSYLSPSVSTAMSNYINGSGKYSPPIIHLPGYSTYGHYVILGGKVSNNVFQVIDPANSSVWNITINGNTATYNGKTDTIDQVHQYFNANASITSDTTPPYIDPNRVVVKKTNTGYSIGTVVSDNVGVTSVKFPTWHAGLTGNDAKWIVGKYEGTYCYWYCNISISDWDNFYGKYYTDIYAYDAAGNSSCYHLSLSPILIEKDAPVISDETYTLTDTGYQVKCKVTDANAILKVQFPTWTTYNGQDDLKSTWSTDESLKGTSIGGGYYTFDVNISDHNNEKGTYITDIYAYDDCGNVSTMKRVIVDLSKPAATSLSNCNISLEYTSTTYSTKAKTPKVTVKNNSSTLIENTDYTVAYSNNVNAGTATVTITGIGNNYTGTTTKTFTIKRKNFNDWEETKTVEIEYPASNIKSYWTMTSNGYKLVEGKDYTVSTEGEIKVGNTVKVIYSGINNFIGDHIYTFTIVCTNHKYGNWIVSKESTCTSTGKKYKYCSICNKVVTEIIPKMEHSIIYGEGYRKETYFQTGYTGDDLCQYCGTVIYWGRTTAKLKLSTPKVTIKSGKKFIKVTYKKVEGATGYQVKYKIGTKAVIKTYKSAKTTTRIYKNLKKGNYKVCVRSYVKSGSRKAYSNWTTDKSVKVK